VITQLTPDVLDVTFKVDDARRAQMQRARFLTIAAVVVVCALCPLPAVLHGVAAQAVMAAWQALGGGGGGGAGHGTHGLQQAWAGALVAVGRMAVAAALLAAALRPTVVSESLVVAAGLGAQTAVRKSNGAVATHFIPAASLRTVVVNEGVQMCDVHYYLAVLVAGRKTLVLPFEHARPRLPVLGRVFRLVAATLRLPGSEGVEQLATSPLPVSPSFPTDAPAPAPCDAAPPT
jgi:hypothetical protein